ncbi:kinesin light chain [Octopus sinensis]|uniref:Kinesin light chain n=1 Tax=Octopus sinensis TaxID=2607531 RepID=A0A6P7SR26_9MOLL|nr:kinesin light chain [Octopus sinensis]XP_036361710.1 kinesin light chain [Octopus sinensis]
MEKSDLDENFTYQDDIIRRTRKAIRDLHTLRNEHLSIINNIKMNFKSNVVDTNDITVEKLDVLKHSQEAIDLALEEAEITMLLTKHLQYLEGENLKLRTEVSLLRKENDWLRSELLDAQTKLQNCQESLVVAEEKIKHFEFMKELNFDENEEKTDYDSEGKCRPSSFDLSFLDDIVEDAESPGYEIPARFRSLYDLITQYVMQGRHQVALTLCKQTIQNLEKTSRFNPEEAIVLHMQARIYKDMGNMQEAVRVLKAALLIRENTVGHEHPSVAAVLNNLAVIYGKSGNFKDAEKMCKRALEIKEKIHGTYHPSVAKLFNNLALLCQNQNKYEQAEYYYNQSLEIYKSMFGNDHMSVMKSKNNHASLYLRQGKYRQAQDIYREFLYSFVKRNTVASMMTVGIL